MKPPRLGGSDPWHAASLVEALAPSSLFSLDGKVVIVTGAGGGIGRWISAGLAAAGASLVLTDVVADTLEVIAEELRRRGAKVEVIVADLTIPEAPASIVRFALDRFGQLDSLINNAGVNRRMPILEMDVATLDLIWTVNFRQPYVLAQQAARVMIERGGGSIINIGSINSLVGVEDLSVYGPTKAALSQLTRVMAIEWSRFGIRANAIAPGFLDTPMNETHWSHATRAPWIMDRIPMCRPGQPLELVGACLLLASDAGSYICGQTIVVDGGFTAGSRWDEPSGTGLTAFREHGGYGLPGRFTPADGEG